jgi:hypothetical protein
MKFSSTGSGHPDLQSGGSAVRARQLPQKRKGSQKCGPFFVCIDDRCEHAKNGSG